MATSDIQNAVVRVAIEADSKNGADFDAVEIDTVVNNSKAEYAAIYFQTGNAIGANMTALKVQESDTSGSGFADITGAAFTGADLPQSGETNQVWAFYIRLSPTRKRYLQVVATAGASATDASALAVLTPVGVGPINDTERGLNTSVIV